MKYFKKTKDVIYIKNAKYKISIIQISDLHYSDLIREKDLKNLIILSSNKVYLEIKLRNKVYRYKIK